MNAGKTRFIVSRIHLLRQRADGDGECVRCSAKRTGIRPSTVLHGRRTKGAVSRAVSTSMPPVVVVSLLQGVRQVVELCTLVSAAPMAAGSTSPP